jgi:omega-6 fatty acid desaturase (delta-12 desaturase)
MSTALPQAAAVFTGTRDLAESGRSARTGAIVLGIHVSLYAVTLAGALAPWSIGANMIFAVLNGLFIALLFVVAHDAAHGSYVPGRNANRWIARFAFLPCVHSASLWTAIHNRMHHRRTNLKGVDTVWTPMNKADYDAAHPLRRALERLYRSAWGPLIYYYIEFWIHRMLLPLAPEVRGQWKRHLPDSIFAVSGFALTLGVIVCAAGVFTPERPLWLVLLLAWVIPYAVWSYLMAFTIYLNHTHPDIPWFGSEQEWRTWRGKCRETAHVRLPVNAVPLYTKVMNHPAHHADTTVPVYVLPEAQARIRDVLPTSVEYMLTPRAYMDIVQRCKLFDYENHRWTDFDGTPTTPRLLPSS